ncbi:EmrB/QacA subfamily drug resistance transporter [Streptomyces sp. 1114.5]|uniref:MFS transporter n=1 Tax=Streptomyces sp. 1114.5 TaxID=1938830 RepID=UPI000F29B0A6|nr:EmrB/QacA subfamily drug resistance transporter [Streptomyces sp. 1114.5]
MAPDALAEPAPAAPTLMTPARRRLGMMLCLVTIVLAVLDMNIVSAATVPIVRDLDPVHGVDRLPWLVSAFALAATALLPLYGKLCDVHGAKRVLLGAVGTFLVGSALCGAAQTMGQLIAFRAVQGIGGGGLMSVTMVVIAQLKEPEERGGGKGGAMGGIVAGLGMAIGPLIGALFTDHLSWRWIFYVNLPLGLVVLAGVALVVKLPSAAGRRRLDFPGAALAAAFATGLLLVTEWGGKDYGWASPVILGLGAATLAVLALFLWRQSTAAEPVLPLSLFRIRVVRLGFAIQGLVGMGMTGSIMFVMLYLQIARGVAPTAASLYLIPMAAGMTAVGLLTGRLVSRGHSSRTFLVAGAGCSALALALLALSGPATGLWAVCLELALLGGGLGQLIGQLIAEVQQAAPAHQLGVATTGVRFFQTLGSALGAALFGTVLARVFEAGESGRTLDAVRTLTGAAREHALGSFTDAVDVVFLSASGVMVLVLVLALRLRASGGAAGERSEPEKPVLAA